MGLRAENYIGFFTISGFFCGLVFSVLKTNTPIDMLMYTLTITMAFYLFVHILVINFIDIRKASKELFNQDEYEQVSSYFIHELQERENLMEQLIDKKDKHEKNVIKNYMEQNGVPQKKTAA